MYVMFSTKNRKAVGGLLLAISRTEMRLAVPGESDALELQLVDGHWTGEDGNLFVIDSMLDGGVLDYIPLASDVFPKTLTASN
jgi:hypothetical protein